MRALLGRLAAATVALAGFLGWGSAPQAEVAMTVRVPRDLPVGLEDLTLEPASAVHAARLWRSSRVTLLADADSARVTLRGPGLCPTEVAVTPGAPEIAARPWIDLGGDRAQVGFDAPFEIDVVAGCAEAERGNVTWRQTEGPPLVGLETDRRGFHLRARTRPIADLRPPRPLRPLPWGIVPMSPRTQGRYGLEATWTGGGMTVRRNIVVTSMARASGVPSIAVGQRVLLGGSGWHVAVSPRGGRAEVADDAIGPEFAPDAAGRWWLEDASGRRLQVNAGLHDRTPLDCGRAECHAAQAEGSTRMTAALESFIATRGLTPGETCMLDCHVVGERGLHDGGFLDVARALPFRVEGATWAELPRALRRVGGVTCTGCHGPAAIPAPSARRTVLSPDVCAVCHDSPPEYAHVEQWRRSRMAQADAPPGTRADAACARCHTTAGFLAALGVRKPDEDDGVTVPVGVACAACHAPHGAHVGDTLVRAVQAPATVGGAAVDARHATSTLCLSCHAPAAGEATPSASAGALWLGRVQLPDGEVFTGPAPHESVDGGCVGCHGGTRPTDHSFRVDTERCSRCHAGARPVATDVSGRARALWARLGGGPLDGAQPHTRVASLPGAAHARARYEVALVLEDGAAGAHNAGFARMLLDDAERDLGAAP